MPTAAKVHRNVLLQQKASCEAAAKISDEPFAQQYRDIASQCDLALAGLPADDQPVEEKHSTALASLLAASTSLCTLLTGALDTHKKNQAASLASAVTAEVTRRIQAGELIEKASLTAAIDAEITRRTTAGELVIKATVDQLCSTAKTNGIAEGEQKVRNEMAAQQQAAQKIAERKTALQTASFPLPGADTQLGGTDEEYAARKTKAETRRTALQTAGFKALGPELLANVWADDPAYKAFENTIANIPALKSTADPAAGGGGAGAPGTVFIV
ncbi:MAG: hypothetical protein A2Y38_01890 [Spirochaetes bacterium GWB1_59_5]|nr:MAG: hypothetical protein A2Y38_01890 [Spirochaetes bacterium GWB1_59_5]